jgi:hypothetical protein
MYHSRFVSFLNIFVILFVCPIQYKLIIEISKKNTVNMICTIQADASEPDVIVVVVPGAVVAVVVMPLDLVVIPVDVVVLLVVIVVLLVGVVVLPVGIVVLPVGIVVLPVGRVVILDGEVVKPVVVVSPGSSVVVVL